MKLNNKIAQIPGYSVKIKKALYPDHRWIVICDHDYNVDDLLQELKGEGVKKVKLMYKSDRVAKQEQERDLILNYGIVPVF